MSGKSKREYLQEIKKRYFTSTKLEKGQILDEFCKNCSYNRKYAIRAIHKKEEPKPKKKEGKGRQGVFTALTSIVEQLPFTILGFDSDNGTEFLNWNLLEYFTKRKNPLQYTRSREYRKNDNAHIEEKNWTHVRQYLGYQRFENINMVTLMNNLYLNEWRYFLNYFIPSFKLIKKESIIITIIFKFKPVMNTFINIFSYY